MEGLKKVLKTLKLGFYWNKMRVSGLIKCYIYCRILKNANRWERKVNKELLNCSGSIVLPTSFITIMTNLIIKIRNKNDFIIIL